MSQTQKDYQRQHNIRPKQIDLLAAYRTLFVAYVRNHPTEADERFVEGTSSATTNNGIEPTSDVTAPIKR